MKRYSLVNLRQCYLEQKQEIDRAIQSVVEQSAFFLGEELKKFEVEFSRFLKAKYVLGLGSGTAALKLALQVLDIGPGDEVITTPSTFIADAEAIVAVGAKPVFVDIKPNSLNIDPEKIESAITKKTKAIIVVHLYGVACQIDKIIKIAKRHQLKVIEDCAQAQGTRYKGRVLGTFGEIGCFSFYPTKVLGAFGDGGAVMTNNKSYYEKILLLRNHGRKKNKGAFKIIGDTLCLDNVQAGVLRVKLKKISGVIQRRFRLAKRYNLLLKNYEWVKPMYLPENCMPSLYVYTVKILNRDKIRRYLESKGIETGVYYLKPLHLQQSLRFLGYKKGDFPVAEKVSQEVLSLPFHQGLTVKDLDYIVGVLKEGVERFELKSIMQ